MSGPRLGARPGQRNPRGGRGSAVRGRPPLGEKRGGFRRLRGVLLMYRDVRMSGPRMDARLGQTFGYSLVATRE